MDFKNRVLALSVPPNTNILMSKSITDVSKHTTLRR